MALVKYNNNSISAVTTTGLASGSLVHIKTLTASSSATLSFVHGTDGVVLDSTYPIYKFEFINIHPANNDTDFTVNFRDGGSAYDATKTTTYFRASHGESGSPASLQYESAVDLAQSTAVQKLSKSGMGNENDESLSGELFIYSPSSTTFIKHFIARTHYYGHDNQSSDDYIAGYNNVTVAIDGVQFAMTSGNIDSGKIKLYGIKDS